MNISAETGAMSADRDERVRHRAYQIWDEAGRPEGRHEEHWHQAMADIDAEEGNSVSAPMPAARWAPNVTGGHGDGSAEGERRTIERNLGQAKEDASGQFVGTQHDDGNEGVSSAEPRTFSGDGKGDATCPLKQNKRKGK